MKPIEEKLDIRPDLQQYLFIRGFYITTDKEVTEDKFPFYGNFQVHHIGGFRIYVHKLQKLFMHDSEEADGGTMFLIGHCYNPFTMEHREEVILKNLFERKQKSFDDFIAKLNELTGIFILGEIRGDDIEIVLDASGMQYACYGVLGGQIHIASHMALLGDVCNLRSTQFVRKLIGYRWYKYMMGNYLPGDITPFEQVKRLIPNTFVTIINGEVQVTRFYPCRSLNMCKTVAEYEAVIAEGARIMHNNMKLIAKKWSKPAISLTGGIDSNTTFAAANGLYERFSTFSYVSMSRENVDAEAAKRISESFSVPHRIYCIPEDNEVLGDFKLFKEILAHNDGEIGPQKDNDVRKKIFLMQHCDCDVEVKSWISETIRAYAYKYFGKKKMPSSLSPRNYTSLYKIFFLNRPLVWKTDRYFAEYLKNTQLKEHLYNYDESDFFVWEMMHGGKCGLNIGTMKFCFDITIPYNNRNFLDLMLRIPLEQRLNDSLHLDMKKRLNAELAAMNIRIVNLNETRKRKRMANLYFTINSHLPF